MWALLPLIAVIFFAWLFLVAKDRYDNQGRETCLKTVVGALIGMVIGAILVYMLVEYVLPPLE